MITEEIAAFGVLAKTAALRSAACRSWQNNAAADLSSAIRRQRSYRFAIARRSLLDRRGLSRSRLDR
jgi:hypothetical protein